MLPVREMNCFPIFNILIYVDQSKCNKLPKFRNLSPIFREIIHEKQLEQDPVLLMKKGFGCLHLHMFCQRKLSTAVLLNMI